jgi:hypothetical protein
MVNYRDWVDWYCTESPTNYNKGWNNMNTTKGRRIFAVILTTVLMVSVTGSALASHGDVSLPGSNFEIDTDANLKVDHASPPSLDWANVTELRQADTASGSADEPSAKEPGGHGGPSVVDGSIPPNKSDLKFFGIYQEGGSTNGFLQPVLVAECRPSGTTNMDFEFNQSNTPPPTGSPRSALQATLIQYDPGTGGTNPKLSFSTWVTSGPKSLCEAANSTPLEQESRP